MGGCIPNGGGGGDVYLTGGGVYLTGGGCIPNGGGGCIPNGRGVYT